jgi:putative alpha-1,2-mannosidase
MFSYKMIALLLGLFLLPLLLAQGQLVDQVDPLIGTAGEGQTYPGAGVPFGMTQWSPETRKGEGKCVAPYYYGDKRVFGIRASHFMSGSCTQEFGSLTLVPLAGPVTAAAIEAGLPLDHREEFARPFV